MVFSLDLTGSFYCDFEFSCLVLQRGGVWGRACEAVKTIVCR